MNRSVTHAAVLGFLLLGTLFGCETPATRPSFPDIRFTNEPRLRLDVAAIEIQDDFHATFHAPNVEHLFPVAPEHALENWVHDRLEATGTTRRVRVRITDASVTETELPRTPGLRGAFTTDQAERYDATVGMTIDLLNDRGFPERTATTTVGRTQSVAEGITPNQRDEAWYAMTKDLMAAFNRDMEAKLRDAFTFYVQ